MNSIAKKAVEDLKNIQRSTDIEWAHQEADEVLLRVLEELNLTEIVDAYCAIERRHA
jgi:hypothetical protein